MHTILTHDRATGLIYAAPLETLNLTSNQLVGTVNFLWANQQLKQFDVSNNLLSGEVRQCSCQCAPPPPLLALCLLHNQSFDMYAIALQKLSSQACVHNFLVACRCPTT